MHYIVFILCFKVFGPLKACFESICGSFLYARQGVKIDIGNYPSILGHAIDQTTPASVNRSFEVTGLYPLNKRVVDGSPLVTATSQNYSFHCTICNIIIELNGVYSHINTF